MGVRRKQKTAAPLKEDASALSSGRKYPPEAFEDYDDIRPKDIKAIQDRADKVLRKGKWVVVDGDAGEG